MKVDGKPLLWYPLHSLLKFAGEKNVIVATSFDESDDPIKKYCEKVNIRCHRGSLTNVAERFRACISELDCKYVVRICGDNVFVSHAILKRIADLLDRNHYDFISNTPNRTFPYGMSVEVVRKDLYIKHFSQFDERMGDFEHVMPYFYRTRKISKLYLENESFPDTAGMRLTVDEEIDVKRIEFILAHTSKPYYLLELDELHKLYHKAEAVIHAN